MSSEAVGGRERVESVLRERRVFRQRLTAYVQELIKNSDTSKVEEFARLRKMYTGAIYSANIFYIKDYVDLLLPDYLDDLESFGVISANGKPIYHERWVIPIYDSEGLVQGLVGYSPVSNERYVYAVTEYYMRGDTLWGLERLNRAYELGYAILTEGITDALHIRSLGYEPVFAMCGTRKSAISMFELNRCRYGIVRIPDRDIAGMKAVRSWETNRYVTLTTPINYKDADETLRESEDNGECFRGYLDLCVGWLKEKEHKGEKSEKEKICMI